MGILGGQVATGHGLCTVGPTITVDRIRASISAHPHFIRERSIQGTGIIPGHLATATGGAARVISDADHGVRRGVPDIAPHPMLDWFPQARAGLCSSSQEPVPPSTEGVAGDNFCVSAVLTFFSRKLPCVP
jgi:hypothetical protein